MSRPIVSSDGHVVFKLRQLKNVQIKLANHILSKTTYILNRNKLFPRFDCYDLKLPHMSVLLDLYLNL